MVRTKLELEVGREYTLYTIHSFKTRKKVVYLGRSRFNARDAEFFRWQRGFEDNKKAYFMLRAPEIPDETDQRTGLSIVQTNFDSFLNGYEGCEVLFHVDSIGNIPNEKFLDNEKFELLKILKNLGEEI